MSKRDPFDDEAFAHCIGKVFDGRNADRKRAMKTCATCPRPLNAGRTTGNHGDTRCLICITAALFKGWVYPPKKGKSHAR